MPQLFKLQNEFVLISVVGPHYPTLNIYSISKNYDSKDIEFNHREIPEYMVNGSFECQVNEKSNAIFIDCSNLNISKKIYKYIYKDGKVSKLNYVDNAQVKSNHCAGEYKFYKELRANKPRGGYNSMALMPNSIVQGLNRRLNIEESEYAQILDSQKELTSQQFKTNFCP